MTLKLTTEDLNDILNNKPYGYYSMLKTKYKNAKNYNVRIQGFQQNKHPTERMTIFAKSSEDAVAEAKDRYTKMYPDLTIDGWYHSASVG